MKKTITSSLFGRTVGGGSLALMLLIVAALLLPVSDRAKATTNAEAYVGVRAATTIGLYLGSDSVNMDMVPTSEGVFSAKTLKFGVETNSEAGYRVLMSTLGGTNSLVSTNTTKNEAKYMIPSITTETAGTNFTGNAWGYTVGVTDEGAVYKAVPSGDAAEIVITETSTAGQRDEYDLTFGAHIDTGLPAGNYGNTVLISAVANAEKVTNLNQVTYMQDITPEVCANTPEGTERQLYDVRDGNKYWVTKMKDGHCWMIQNLALDLVGGKTYTAADTDLANTETKSWTVPVDKGTETEIPLPGTVQNDGVDSWNLGKIIMKSPTASRLCPSPSVPDDGINYPNTDAFNSAFHGQSLAETCSQYFKNVEGWLPTFTATSTSSYNDVYEIYDARYLLGNYYQFGAATAGTGIGLSSPASAGTSKDDLINAPGSICPKGWTLPKSGRNISADYGQAFDIDGSFYNLLKAYSLNGDWATTTNGNAWLHLVPDTILSDEPTYLVMGGVLHVTTASIREAGQSGIYWSSTVFPDSKMNAYYFYYNFAGRVLPANSNGRYNGFSVRCISAE